MRYVQVISVCQLVINSQIFSQASYDALLLFLGPLNIGNSATSGLLIMSNMNTETVKWDHEGVHGGAIIQQPWHSLPSTPPIPRCHPSLSDPLTMPCHRPLSFQGISAYMWNSNYQDKIWCLETIVGKDCRTMREDCAQMPDWWLILSSHHDNRTYFYLAFLSPTPLSSVLQCDIFVTSKYTLNLNYSLSMMTKHSQ